jgi:hypothetical protein
LHPLARTLGLLAALSPLAALAAGADGSWSWCSQPKRLSPDPAGRTFHVSPSGTDPKTCPTWSGYWFRTISRAATCARGKDTLYVHDGTYGPVQLANMWPSDTVLITNAPGEHPIIDGWGTVPDFGAIVGLWRVSNVAIQGLEIRNTVHDTARHGILTNGHQMEVVGNEVYNTVMRNQWFKSDYWDAAVTSQPNRNQWGYKLIGNSIHDSYGECADVLAVDGATVEGNRIYNCVSTNIFVSGSQNVTVNRNWVYANTDKFNRKDYGSRATGIQLANEGKNVGWTLNNIRITNNIIEWVSQGVRYWKAPHTGQPVKDTYGDLYIAFNDFNRTQFSPIRFDTPEGWAPQGSSKLRRNLVLNRSAYKWFSTDQGGSWDVTGNWNYGTSTTATSPGIQDTWGTYVPAYEFRSGAVIRWTIAPWSEPEMPSTDYHCQSRGQNDWNTPGAIN